MTGKLTRIIAAGAISGAIVLVSGCASVDEISELRQMAESAQATADAAAATASEAQQSAADASFKADQAMQAAARAQACCDANSEKMERMFQRSMMK